MYTTQTPSMETSMHISAAGRSPNDTWFSVSANNITYIKEDHVTDVAQDPFQSLDAALLVVSIVAVLVVILILVAVVLRYVAHQKGIYYTHEEALTLKSDPDVQVVQEVQDIQEDSDKEDS